MMNDPKNTNEETRDLEPACLIELSGGRKTIVDKIDYAYLDRWNWSSMGKYAGRHEKGNSILMGRVIARRMGFNMAFQIAYKDGNSLNNRRSNILPTRRQMPRPRKGGQTHEETT
jgi:hypothetical protein